MYFSFQLLYYSALIGSFINTFYHFAEVFTVPSLLLLILISIFVTIIRDLVGILNSIFLLLFPRFCLVLDWDIFCGLILPNYLCLFLVYELIYLSQYEGVILHRKVSCRPCSAVFPGCKMLKVVIYGV